MQIIKIFQSALYLYPYHSMWAQRKTERTQRSEPKIGWTVEQSGAWWSQLGKKWQSGSGARSGCYRNRLERGAAFSPLTLRWSDHMLYGNPDSRSVIVSSIYLFAYLCTYVAGTRLWKCPYWKNNFGWWMYDFLWLLFSIHALYCWSLPLVVCGPPPVDIEFHFRRFLKLQFVPGFNFLVIHRLRFSLVTELG